MADQTSQSASEPAATDLAAMAAATPDTRDRYVDFLRGFSILVVVFGHWLIAVVVWREGEIEGFNALERIDGLWALTWLLQVMPLFFFVGGFSNLRSHRASTKKGQGYAGFIHGRLVRMMRPTIVFLGVGLVVVTILDAANVADSVVFPVSELIARPLWFLGVYMIVVALAPLMLRLHDRFGLAVPAAMAAAAIVIDIVRLGLDVGGVGYANYPLVWLLTHQLGFVYADGDLLLRARWWLAGTGLAALIALVQLGPYPGSMVGLSTDEFSNMDPPTIAIAALTIWQIGLAMILRRPVSRWLARTRPWTGVIFVNSVIMTVFLWHLTAMVIGIGILFPLGFPQPDAGSAQWWLLRPVWVALLIVVLAVFVILFGRFEARTGRTPTLSTPPGRVAGGISALGVAMTVLGVLGFAMGGLHQLFSLTGTELIIFNLNPLQNVIHLLLGGALVAAALRPRTLFLAASAACVVLLTLGVAGVFMVSNPDVNHLAANHADNVLHFGAAAIALVLAGADRRRDRVTRAPAARPDAQGASRR